MRTPPRIRTFRIVLGLLALAPPATALGQFGGTVVGGMSAEQLQAGPRPRHPAHPVPVAVARTWLKLQKVVKFEFAEMTPLEDVIQYIREVTAEKDEEGKDDRLPFYAEPGGLAGAEKTTGSPVTLQMDRIAVVDALGLMLKQIGLTFEVRKDGIVTITNEGNSERSDYTLPLSAEAARTWLKLHRPVAKLSIKDASLSDALDVIKQATIDKECPAGVQVFAALDALAKVEAKVSLALEGVPIATSLEFITSQVGMTYRVQEDGIVVIRDQDEDDPLPIGHGPEAIAFLRARLEVAKLLAEIARYKAAAENPTPMGMGGMGGGMQPPGGQGMRAVPAP